MLRDYSRRLVDWRLETGGWRLEDENLDFLRSPASCLPRDWLRLRRARKWVKPNTSLPEWPREGTRTHEEIDKHAPKSHTSSSCVSSRFSWHSRNGHERAQERTKRSTSMLQNHTFRLLVFPRAFRGTPGMATRRHKNARRDRQACSKITHCVFLCFLAFFAAVCCLLRESRFHSELLLVIARTGLGAISTPHQRRPVGCRPRPTSRSRRTRKAIPKSPKLLRCSSVKMTVCATQHVLVQVPNRSHRRPPRRTHALHPGPMPPRRSP